MYDILIVTHGSLGKSLLDTARLILGEADEGARSIGFLPGESVEALQRAIATQVASSAESGGCLVLCDIVGGSPFLSSALVAHNSSPATPVQVVAGLSLGMFLETYSQRKELSLEEGARLAETAAKQSIRRLEDPMIGGHDERCGK